MKEGYALEWLDTLITVTLNPVKTDVEVIQFEDIMKLRKSVEYERAKIAATIKQLVFNARNESQIKYFIKLYHSSLIVLLDQAIKNQKHHATLPGLKQLSDELVLCVDELILFIERRFVRFLGLVERLPATYLSRVKEELGRSIWIIGNKFKSNPAFQTTVDILIPALVDFLGQKPEEHKFTFPEIAYLKELCLEIECLEPSNKSNFISVLDEQLIYMNFNDRRYINSLLQRLTNNLNSYEKIEDKMEYLLLHAKAFRQLHRKPGAIFSDKNPDLIKVLLNWFRHEISYLEKKMRLPMTTGLPIITKETDRDAGADRTRQKVMCVLSTDQTGLIIRAADELRILVAKSMSQVFKTIVPHLSTPYKEDLSYDGMRSKSFVAEERDKQKAIEALQRIIKKIEEY